MLKEKIYVGIPVYDEEITTIKALIDSLKYLRGLNFECTFLVNCGIAETEQVQNRNKLALNFLRNLDLPNIKSEELVIKGCNIGIARGAILNMIKTSSELDKGLSARYFISIDADTQFSVDYVEKYCQMRKDYPNAKFD
jgi:hypothetical protein